MYLVTGASGNVGSEIVTQLLAEGKRVRAYVRDPAKLAPFGDRIEVASGDYDTPDAFSRALDNVEGIFLMNIGDTAPFGRLVSQAAAQRVPRVVFLSSHMVETVPDTPLSRVHREKEDLIRAAGTGGRILRPGGFMSNAYFWIPGIKAQGVVYNPMGDGLAPPIAPEDIAAVAVRALTDASLGDEVLTLTGGEAIRLPQQVDMLAQALGKPLRCVDISLDEAVANLQRIGIPAPIAASVVKSYEAVRDGRGAMVTDTVERVTGRHPIRFADWVRKHLARFA